MLAVWSSQMQHAQTLRTDSTSIREVSVTAPRMNRNVTSALPVQEMKRGEMEQLGFTDLGDALSRMAGTNVKDYGGLGGLKTISVRNMGAAHTAVTLDGVPVSQSQAGQIDIGRFDLRHLESLSLAVGHQEDLLQPARLFASAAVLSLQSIQPSFLQNRRWSVNASCKAGQWGEVCPDLFYQQMIGSSSLVSANAHFLRSDGCYPYRLTIPQVGTTEEKRYNNDLSQWHGEVNLRQSFANQGQLDVKIYGYESEQGLPGHVIFHNVEDSHQRTWDRTAFIQGTYSQHLAPQWDLMVQGKGNYGYSRYRDEDEKYAAGYMEEEFTQREAYASMAVTYTPHRAWTFSLSQDGSLNTLRSPLNFCPDPNRYTLLTALNARYATSHLRLTACCVGTYVTESVRKGNEPADIRHLSPSLALRYTPFLQLPLYLRLMYKNTFRVPSFNDLYYRNTGNLNLKPEDAQELSAGLTLTRQEAFIFRNTSLTLDGYFNLVNHKIVAIPTNYVWSMRNYGKARMAGIDATLHTTLPICQHVSFALSATYSWMRAIDVTDAQKKSYKNQLPYTPRHSGNASVLLCTPWINVGYTVKGVGTRYILAQNIPANEVEAYQDHSITMSHSFEWRTCQLKIVGSVTNLLDRNYDVIHYYPMPGRALHLTAEVKL